MNWGLVMGTYIYGLVVGFLFGFLAGERLMARKIWDAQVSDPRPDTRDRRARSGDVP